MTALFDPLVASTVAMEVLAAGYATPGALALQQSARLTRLVSAAVQGSPFYRERLRGVMPGVTPLADLPTVSRGELMARFDDWVTDREVKLEELHAFTKDFRRIGDFYRDKYIVWESSGTSCQPGVFVQDAHAMAVYDALEALRRTAPHFIRRCLDPMLVNERVAFVGATTGHFASIVSIQRLRRINPWMSKSLRCFSILQSGATLVNQLNAFAPTVIVTYPTAAAMLADFAILGQLRVNPLEMWTGGEKLSTRTRERVAQAWGCTLRESYGASEFFSIGWECAKGRIHANTDWVILEPIDKDGRAVPAGQLSHSTLLTNLANYVQPIIRYELGDRMIMSDRRCECGSPLPVIDVEGRIDDTLVMAGRDGQAVTLLPLALTTVLEDGAGVYAFQLRQRDRHTLVLRLELQGEEAKAAAARCRAALKRYATAQGLVPLSIVVEAGKPVPKGRSGKAQRIVACSEPEKR